MRKDPYATHGREFFPLSAPCVLAWFRQAWTDEFARAEGGGVFAAPIENAAADSDDHICPTDDDQLLAVLERHLEPIGFVEIESHFVHLTGDDDLECYLFDDQLLRDPDALHLLPSPRTLRDDQLGSTDDDEDDEYAELLQRFGH